MCDRLAGGESLSAHSHGHDAGRAVALLRQPVPDCGDRHLAECALNLPAYHEYCEDELEEIATNIIQLLPEVQRLHARND